MSDKKIPKNETETIDNKPKIFKQPLSPFNNDIYNKRGGKKGGKSIIGSNSDVSKIKMKSVNVKKFKGGSGGDR